MDFSNIALALKDNARSPSSQNSTICSERAKMTTIDDILKAVNNLSQKVDRNTDNLRKDLNKVNNRINVLGEKVDTAKQESIDKELRDEVKMNAVQKRLEQIELKMTAAEKKCEERERTLKEQSTRTNNFKESVGLEVNTEEKEPKPKSWTEIMKESKEKNDEKNKEDRDRKMLQWNKQVQRREKVNEIEKVTNTPKDTDKETEIESRRQALKMGDSPRHEEEDWSWDECGLDWEGTSEKKDNEKRKKVERYRRKKAMQAKTAGKARHILGLGPIRLDSINYFFEATADWDLAKKLAVNEYLEEYLQFNVEEIKDFDVVETLIAKSDDSILYVTFTEIESIKEIHKRAAELKNEEIMIRNFIPPQFWERYRFISQYCSELRQDNSNLKTKIQFSDYDIEVYTKLRGTEDQYKILPLAEIEEHGPIPKFNFSIEWRKRSDRPPRNPPKPVVGKVCPPSMRQNTLSRQRSSSTSMSSPKRQKTKDPLQISPGPDNHEMEL